MPWNTSHVITTLRILAAALLMLWRHDNNLHKVPLSVLCPHDGQISVYLKIRGNFFGVPIIRTIVFGGLYWGPPIDRNYHIDNSGLLIALASCKPTQHRIQTMGYVVQTRLPRAIPIFPLVCDLGADTSCNLGISSKQ